MSSTHYVPRCRRCKKILGLYPRDWRLEVVRELGEGEHVDSRHAVIPCGNKDCQARYVVRRVDRVA